MIEHAKPRPDTVRSISLGVDREKKEGRGLSSGLDSMSEKEERGENGFDLATCGGLIQSAFGVGLIWAPMVVCVLLTMMVVCGI
ncbi:hypothetical protein Dsin_000908 [Dipteronia sinensis]|uniref:Uncharacterized protein n=1 Tax=Dipteronia sinensis TaxID=43782 RepID=A0AAE0EIH4_9ROSI|nr:hypothetical protein Dsin_000908 [Dipteronia sinensis]